MRNEIQNLELELARLDVEIRELTGEGSFTKNPELGAISCLQLQSLPSPKQAIIALRDLSERVSVFNGNSTRSVGKGKWGLILLQTGQITTQSR